MSNSLTDLRIQVETCRKCELWKTRSKAVFGEGPVNAKIFLIGLGPGYYENLEGKPFVGPAGKLLDDLLVLSGWKREEVYITNIMKSYLPENKATDQQIEACTPYLDKQIDALKPKAVLLLGNVAARYILHKFGLPKAPMHQMHGRVFYVSTLLMQAKIIPMYHPAAALRNPALRIIIENDWRKLPSLLK